MYRGTGVSVIRNLDPYRCLRLLVAWAITAIFSYTIAYLISHECDDEILRAERCDKGMYIPMLIVTVLVTIISTMVSVYVTIECLSEHEED